MQTFSPLQELPETMRLAEAMRRCAWALCFAMTLAPALATHAQTLAHRNWQGSGMTAEPWWRSAVFYRIEPANFQDPSGSGHGDLKGVAERMGYLRALGIDAIVLEPPFDENDSAGFGTLLESASQNHIRVLVGVRNDPTINPVAHGRAWLSRGAAGIEVEAAGTNTNSSVANSSLANSSISTDTISALRAAARSYPGERVVMARVDATASATLRSLRNNGPDLLAVDIDAVARKDNSPAALTLSLRQSLSNLQSLAGPPVAMLLSDDTLRSASVFAPVKPGGPDARTLGMNAVMAAMLFASQPGAVSLLYGQELGLESTSSDVPMQWTPTNITPPGWKPEDNRAEEEAEDAAANPKPKPAQPSYDPNVYGEYHPYVAPKKDTGPAPFDPNTLRGFSAKGATNAGAGPSPFIAAGVDAKRSVALEERDPQSLLNFYARLIALHHDDPVLRAGALRVFEHDAQNALVWVRVPPTGVATARAAVVICNLGDQPLTLSLDDDLRTLRLRPNSLRRLTSSPDGLFESTSRVSLPPHGVYVGEMYR